MPPKMNASSISHGTTPGPKLKRMLGVEEWHQMNHAGFNFGLQLIRDDETLIVRWPKKGIGLDDMVSGAIADGTIANAGIAPVIFPQIPGILARQISQASTAVLNLSGRKSPTYKARAAISRFNDSPLGITDAIRQIVYQLRVYNRGAPIATVPIIYQMDRWPEYGMEAVPFAQDDDRYYLEVDWSRMGSPVPFLPCVFDLEPTGDNEWPYWYRVSMAGKDRWVLLHNSHIVQLVPSHSQMPGIGTSAVYMLSYILADHIIDVDTRVERKISMLSDGLLGVSGVNQTAQEIRDSIEGDNEEARAAGILLSRGYTLLTSPASEVKFEFFSFRQDDGVDFQARREYAEDVLALVMEEFLGAVVTRGGIGYGVQADTNRAAAADAGVEAILRMIEVALGSIYPRVQVSLTRPNDAIKHSNLLNLATFAGAVASLPEGTLSPGEIRAMINRDIIDIPEVTDETVSTDADASDTADNDAGPGTEDNVPSDEETEDDELTALAVDSYALAAYPFAPIDGALKAPEFEALYKIVAAGLLAQYSAADVKAVVAEIRRLGIDTTAPGANDRVAGIVREHMPRLEQTTNTKEFAVLLLLFAQLGRQESERQGRDAGYELDDKGRRILDNSNRAFTRQRTSELYIEATGEASDDDHADIEDPTLPVTLDDYSDRQMAGLIRLAMAEVSDDEVAGFVQAEAPLQAEVRAYNISSNEGGRAYGYGSLTGGRALGAVRKEWLMTTTAPPKQRQDHLLSVGETVGFNEVFSNGDRWSQERSNCRCGIRLYWE